MIEAGVINKSLLNLSIVIRNIINNKKPIPYRDSKLTHILKESLGGNCKTSIIATISQLKSNFEETISTLKFAFDIKKVKNNIEKNEELSINDARIIKDKFLVLQNNYKMIFSKYEELNKELNKEYNNKRNILEEKEKLSKNIEKQNEDINSMLKDILKKEEELKKLKEKNEEMKDKAEKNDIAIKLKNEEIKNLNGKNNKLIEENGKLKSEKINLNRENKELIEANGKLESEITKLQEEKKSLSENLAEKNKSNEKIEKIKNELEKENNYLKSKCDSSKNSINEYLDKIYSLNQKNINLEKQNKKFLFQIEQFTQRISYLEKYLSDLLNDYDIINKINLNGNENSFNSIKNDLNVHVDKYFTCLLYYMNKEKGLSTSNIDLDNDIKNFIDIYGMDALISELKINIFEDVEKLWKLTDEFINDRNLLLKQLNNQKEILVNNIKANVLEKFN